VNIVEENEYAVQAVAISVHFFAQSLSVLAADYITIPFLSNRFLLLQGPFIASLYGGNFFFGGSAFLSFGGSTFAFGSFLPPGQASAPTTL